MTDNEMKSKNNPSMANGESFEVHHETHGLRVTEKDSNYKLKKFLFTFIFGHHMACGILVPQPGIKSSAVKVPSLDHWTIKEFPSNTKLLVNLLCMRG